MLSYAVKHWLDRNLEVTIPGGVTFDYTDPAKSPKV